VRGNADVVRQIKSIRSSRSSAAFRSHCNFRKSEPSSVPSRLVAEGRIAVVTRREAGMRWTRTWLLTSATEADDEIVWFWRPKGSALRWRQCPAHCADYGGKRQGSPGRARISRKPLRREGRCDHRRTCGSCACAVIFCARAPGAAATRSSLRPLASGRVMNAKKLGRIPPRERGRLSLRRHCEERKRRGNPEPRIRLWIASSLSLLAMTEWAV